MKMTLHAAVTALMMFALTSCATTGASAPQVSEVRSGMIEQITMTTVKSDHDHGLGAILGGIAGAGIGSLIGGGTGRDVAIAAGAIAGAVGGKAVQNRYYDKPEPAQQIIVRLKSGVLVSITQPVNQALREQQQVLIDGSGTEARVIPAG